MASAVGELHPTLKDSDLRALDGDGDRDSDLWALDGDGDRDSDLWALDRWNHTRCRSAVKDCCIPKRRAG